MEFSTLTDSVGDMPEAPNLLTIQASREARYVLHSNERFRERPGIGLSETVLDAATLGSLQAVLARWPFAALPDHTGRIPESAPTRVVRLKTATSEFVKQVSPADPVDRRLQEILAHLDAVALAILKHPRQVLRAALLSPAVGAGGSLSLELQLSSLGTEALWLRVPSDIAGRGNGSLRIEVWPAAPEPGSLWSEQKVFVKPVRVEPVASDAALAAVAVLALPPGVSMRFRLAGMFSGKSG